ncbi:MAG: MarR family transcriptional regulator [Rhodobacter sp.]|nr:MarR family transcriptional regulator [Paracoccaceae bacterium]MCB1408209.1 MarR family transcriptional regulator [Paracoccaceae bacterium]MCC0081085.1 MarR family transcriptional regulator [Rhodobacter sp.]
MHSLGLLLHDVSRLLKAEFERRSRETGLTLNQWRVLATLSRKGSQTQAALAAAIEVSPMTVSDVIERLESQGLVSRAPDPQDSRAKRVTLTEAAGPTIDLAREVATQVYARALSGLSETERAAMMHALTHIFDNLVVMAATEKDVA